MPFTFGPGAHAAPTTAYSFVGGGAAANVPFSSHKLTRATPRREMEMRKRLGTGHQTTRREVSIIGRRTGVVIPDTIRRDARGFEDPTHFFDEVREEEELRHASPNVYKPSNARQSLGGGAARPPAGRVASPPRRTSMAPPKNIRAISPIPARPSPAVRGKKKYVESPPSYADERLDDSSPAPRRGRRHDHHHHDSSTDVSRGRSPPPRKSHKDKYIDKRSSKTSYKSRRHQDYSEDTSRDPTPARKRKVTPPRKPSMKTSTAMQTLPTPKGMATQTSRNASTVSAGGRRSTPSASPAPRKRPSPAPVAAASKRRTPTPPAADLNESGFGNDYEYEHHATPSPPKKRTPVKATAASKTRGRPVGGGVSKTKTTKVKPVSAKKEKPVKVKVTKAKKPREKAVYVAPHSGLAEAVLNESTTGARRSSRRMFRPLQYWRNERVVYEREKGGGKLLPEVVDVLIRSPDAGVVPRRRK
jgi:hypothetical protein